MSVGILITARLKSTRLPRKVLRPIQGRPMLHHMIDRLRLAEAGDEIVVCTSHLEGDDDLVAAAEEADVSVFRGDPDDVLARITAAAHHHGHETVVSCTADNPFTDPEHIDRLAAFHLENDNDYSRVEGLPWGTFSYLLRRDAMDRACEIKANADTEVWGEYFTRPGIFRTGVFRDVDPAVRRPDLRLTVDTPEDFALVETLFDALGGADRVFSLGEIVAYVDRHPELRALNANVPQAPAKPIRLRPEDEWRVH